MTTRIRFSHGLLNDQKPTFLRNIKLTEQIILFTIESMKTIFSVQFISQIKLVMLSHLKQICYRKNFMLTFVSFLECNKKIKLTSATIAKLAIEKILNK